MEVECAVMPIIDCKETVHLVIIKADVERAAKAQGIIGQKRQAPRGQRRETQQAQAGQAAPALGVFLFYQEIGRPHPGKKQVIAGQEGAGQGQAVYTLARNTFPQAEVNLHQDLVGKDRLIAIHNSNDVHLPV